MNDKALNFIEKTKDIAKFVINDQKGMMGSTHAAGALALVLYVGLFLMPLTYIASISLWVYILAVYAGQGPDIDHPGANIVRNFFVRPLRWILAPFIDGHRAKETHSLFGNVIFGILVLPIAVIFGIPSWFALVIAYLSHLVLDFINPTGVKLFYCPFLNSKPRSWSVNNFMLNIVDWKNDHDTRSQQGVKTGEFVESGFLSIIIWGFFVFAVFVSYSVLKSRLSGDAFFLAVNPLVFIIGILWLFMSPKLFQFIYKTFRTWSSFLGTNWDQLKIFFKKVIIYQAVGFTLAFFAGRYLIQNGAWKQILNGTVTLAHGITGGNPILFYCLMGFVAFILLWLISIPKLIVFSFNLFRLWLEFLKKNAIDLRDFFHYAVVAQLIFVILLFSSFQYINQYKLSFADLNSKLTQVTNGDKTFVDFIKGELTVLKETYSLGYNQIKEKGSDIGTTSLQQFNWRNELNKERAQVKSLLTPSISSSGSTKN